MSSSLTPRSSGAVDLVSGTGALSKRAERELATLLDSVKIATVRAAAVEQARGYVTTEAVQTVAALASLEEQLLQVAPLAEARIKHLIDQHTLAAGQAIARFGR
jgi:hypothetical protein